MAASGISAPPPSWAVPCAERAESLAVPVDFASIASRVAPVVVKLTVAGAREAPTQLDGADLFAAGDLTPVQFKAPHERSSASGFVVDPDGDILTSAHAVKAAQVIWADTPEHGRLRARVVGLDETTDVAVPKMPAPHLPVAAISQQPIVCTGEWVIAVGAPFGFERSVTAGIASANPRFLALSGDMPLIQTDVALNPGSSGGPLCNARGEVVGTNSMIYSATGGYVGVSFSAPIGLVMRVARQIRQEGRVVRGRIGAAIQPVTIDLANTFGLDGVSGALIIRVEAGSAAENAGLLSGGILLAIGDKGPASYADVQQRVADARSGETLVLDVWRHRALRRLSVVAQSSPGDLPAPHAEHVGRAGPRLGLGLMEANRADSVKSLQGLRVIAAEGAAMLAGIVPGDTVLAVNDVPVSRIPEFDAAIGKLRGRGRVALLISRRGAVNFIPVLPEDMAELARDP